ncbi:M15 family metallopeptidase [Demequina activiva]|uniref:D-alanyl-D-alanine carboxypeptidase n=1 Tax=Demequina activiva TaxID=1582364 RepID=A0A919Q2A1_9MICO|nr:M15 family metallopeptidase [Demequina activiva]GIG54556.1 hypothetical protein Dac01nite_13080 [Demequina activiva]
MHLPPLPFRDIAASVTLTCFAIGLFSAHGTDAVRTHVAVAEARAAAHELQSDRRALDESLSAAERVAHEAKVVLEEDDVAAAAAALEKAVADASAAAANPAPLVVHTPEPAMVEIVVDGATETSSTPHGEPDEANAPESDQWVAKSTADPAATAPAPAPTSADLSAAIAAHQDAAIADRVEEAGRDATKALEGSLTSRQEAHDIAASLAEASETIDRATLKVQQQAASLEAATAAAALELSAADLDTTIELADAQLADATDRIGAVGRRVSSATTVTAALEASAAMTHALDGAREAERTDADAVASARVAVKASQSRLDASLADLRRSHDEWLAGENARRELINDRRMVQHQEDVASARAAHVEANLSAVAARANGWAGQPVGVAGSNGQVASASLCEVDFAAGHLLQCDAARALADANAAYHAETGRHLVVTDTYRSYGLQVTTRSRKPATAAVPGTSNHGWGMAVDLDVASSAWMRAHGDRFGWVHPRWARPGGSKPESWHLEYVAADVGAFEAPAAPALLEPLASAFDEA